MQHEAASPHCDNNHPSLFSLPQHFIGAQLIEVKKKSAWSQSFIEHI